MSAIDDYLGGPVPATPSTTPSPKSQIDEYLDNPLPSMPVSRNGPTIDEFLGPVERPGIIGTLAEGFKATGRAAGSTFDTAVGYAPGVIQRAREQADAPKAEPLEQFYQDIADRKAAAGENPGLLDALGVVGGAVLNNPKGAGYALLEQAPNSLAALAPAAVGMKGGAALGAMAGPGGAAVGGVIGGIAGLFAGNATLEIGNKAMDAAQDGAFTPEEQTAALREGATKGGVITGIDAATLGLSKWITGATSRAVERATTRVLANAGVDVTDQAAVLAARQQPKIVEAVQAAQQAAIQTTSTFGKKAARAGGALALESVGEGLGEYLGELAATGQGDAVEAVLEGVLSLGQSGAEVAWGASKNAAKTAALRLDPNAGPISRAAIAAVEQQNAGALPAPGQPLDGSLGRAPDQTPEQASTLSTAVDTAPPVATQITPDIAQAQQAPARLLPIANFDAATQRAATISNDTGAHHVVIKHPTIPERYAIVPASSDAARNAPSLDVEGLFTVQTPVPLKNARRLVGMLSAMGNPHAIVPSPTGRGFGVAPLDQLSPAQRQDWARFQPGGMRGAARVSLGPVAAPPGQPAPIERSNAPSAPATPIGTPEAAGQRETDIVAALPQQPESAQGLDAEAARAEPTATPATPPAGAPDLEVDVERAAPDLQPLDHGELNIPGRTSTIDAELDRLKADQARQKRTQAKADAATRKAQKAEAKRLFGQHGPAMIEKFAAKFGRKEIEQELDSMVKWEPAKFIDLAQRFEREQAAGNPKQGVPADVEARKPSSIDTQQPLPRPWSLSQDEFTKRVTFQKDGARWSARWDGQYLEAENEEFDHPTLGRTVVTGGRFFKTKREAALVARGAHKRAVRRALIKGEQVAPEALAAYPDLQPVPPSLARPDDQAQNSGTPARPEADPYDSIETRPGTTETQRERGRGALAALAARISAFAAASDRGSATLLGSGLYESFTSTGGARLVGQVVKSPADLAILAQVFRDPRFETFRVFYTKGDEIVGQTAYSSRLPAAVILPGPLDQDIGRDITAFGADGYYVLHNHPSGKAEPSSADEGLTRFIASKVPGFRGHVVIDRNEYAVLDKSGRSTVVAAPELDGVDFHDAPELEHALLGTHIRGPRDLALIGKTLQIESGHATVILTRRQGQVQLIMDLPAALLEDHSKLGTARVKAVTRRMARAAGAGGHRFLVVPDARDLATLKHLVARGIFADVVTPDGDSAQSLVSPGRDFMDKVQPARRKVEDPQSPYEERHSTTAREAPAGYTADLTGTRGETTLPLALLDDRSKFGKAKVRLALRRASRDVGKISTVAVPDGTNLGGLQWLVNEGLVGNVVTESDRPMLVRESVTDFNPARATVKDWVAHQLKQHRGWAMGALTRDQLADLYGADIPQVDRFDRVVQAMDLTRNRMTEQADALVERWRKIRDADQLADVMHSATLAQFDPDQHNATTPEQDAIADAFARLSPDAKALYRDVRDQYRDTLEKLRDALAARVERSGATGTAIADDIRLRFDRYLEEGPYFSLARFGDFILIADKGDERIVEAFESSLKREHRADTLRAQGFTVKLTARQQYSAAKDGAAGSFIGDVLEKIDGLQIDAGQKLALMDGLNQLAISTLPDASYRKHFAHRKGTPGFSNDAMRAFASSQMHAAHHLARIRHADELATLIDEMREEIRSARGNVDTTEHQQVVNELTRRLDLMMNPNTHPVTAALGQVGFVMSLGGSVASGITNLTQTPLVTYPWLGAKFGFDKASGALLRASKDYFGGAWNRWSGFVLADNPNLTDDERRALRHLEDAGLVNLTQAADLAGTSNTDSTVSRRAFVMNRAMKIVGWTFHLPEVFNRQVSALAAYRLARDAGQPHADAIESARQVLIRTHFDYSSSNRARFMSGNVARVLTMFKQYSQQMTYVLWRNAYLALKGESAEVKREARRMLVGVASMHFAAAGSLGLPLGIFGISPLLTLLSMGMGDDDEPFDWETEYRNWLADTFGKKGGEAIAKGPLRMLLNVDLASRVGLGDLWIRPPQKDAEGRDLVEAWMITLLGPVAGYAGQMGTAMQAFEEGKFARGVESMMPKFISAPLRAIRYETEGVRTWAGTDLGITLNDSDIAGVALGFQPTRLAEMYAGRSAVKGREAALQRRREDLMRAWREAREAGDDAGAHDVVDDIREFNSRNRAFAIGPRHLRAHWMAHRRAQLQTAAGIHLSRRRDELRDVGRFANIN